MVLKAIAVPAFEDSKVYEAETPYLKGFLRKGRSRKNGSVATHFEFEAKGKSYTLLVLTTDENDATKVMNMISTIQPVVDIQKGYEEINAQYGHRDKTRYPDELLLLSLISLKGPTVENLNELLRLEESGQDNEFSIDSIKQEITFLSNPLK